MLARASLMVLPERALQRQAEQNDAKLQKTRTSF